MNVSDILPIARAVARLAPSHERDEALGVALLAITNAWRRYEPERGEWRAWARIWARGAVVRYLERRSLELRLIEPAAPDEAGEQLDEGVFDAFARLRQAAQLDREVVQARLAGLTLRAAGERLGCSRTQVMRRERRVLAALGGAQA
ncbi:RNA polymerase sigma factor, sigma-70 family [Nannocystis exedens]|uniref:RNA polymerase sigma factor, sigma-70 family n=1 Tax=Nannocystis exedens TaxID=54 RepID=A0A1I2ILB4_9BACT|nr:sigma-70 family RNA polymerase sigma factor [Nannocystis exedens]PCC73124.1 Sigma-70 region 2 [Nannocystis exedens]SFF41646.1 RNA polymerase sigma factor, sigma-70 family [Nannocystis exedens]